MWEDWDATTYAQENPLSTNEEGRYRWDVPNGHYKVICTSDGYETSESGSLEVPPPQTDVNIGMISVAAPQVAGITAAAGGSLVEIRFSQYMLAASLENGAIVVRDDGGVEVSGMVEAVVAGTAPGGAELALAAWFTPVDPLEADGVYTVTVDKSVKTTPSANGGESYKL